MFTGNIGESRWLSSRGYLAWANKAFSETQIQRRNKSRKNNQMMQNKIFTRVNARTRPTSTTPHDPWFTDVDTLIDQFCHDVSTHHSEFFPLQQLEANATKYAVDDDHGKAIKTFLAKQHRHGNFRKSILTSLGCSLTIPQAFVQSPAQGQTQRVCPQLNSIRLHKAFLLRCVRFVQSAISNLKATTAARCTVYRLDFITACMISIWPTACLRGRTVTCT